MEVQVQNLTVGEQTYNLINSNREHIYRVEYNSTNTTLNVTAWTDGNYNHFVG